MSIGNLHVHFVRGKNAMGWLHSPHLDDTIFRLPHTLHIHSKLAEKDTSVKPQ
jgi:hypothetical protein